MSHKDLTKLLEDREKFFEDHDLECTCDIGRSVCKNCQTYYSPMGKTRLKIKSWFRR